MNKNMEWNGVEDHSKWLIFVSLHVDYVMKEPMQLPVRSPRGKNATILGVFARLRKVLLAWSGLSACLHEITQLPLDGFL